MLPKAHRLLQEKDFQNVFQKGRGFYMKGLGVKCVSRGIGETRFGFSLSLKVSKKAVERNRIKRQLREIIREVLPRIRKGYDCVLVVSPECRDLDFREKKETALAILKKIKLLE